MNNISVEQKSNILYNHFTYIQKTLKLTTRVLPLLIIIITFINAPVIVSRFDCHV